MAETRNTAPLASSPATRPAQPASGEGAVSLLALSRIAGVARELGASTVEAAARETAQRLGERRFFVACLGQFKRGKSSVLNALVGRSVLPVGVPPVTTTVTILRHGSPARAAIRLSDGRTVEADVDGLSSFVDERENPGNVKGVAAVEVFLPAPLLESGLCLVDTPGLGSVFESNTTATRSFLPQVDAALVVLGSDPPITGEEADLLVQVADRTRHVLIVLNKADRASSAEIAEAAAFAREVIATRLGRPPETLLEVSARERLETGLATRDWSALERAIDGLARHSRTEILASSGEQAVRRLGDGLLREIGEREKALLRPLEATEARVGRLREAARGAERLRADLGALLAATEAELARRFEAHRAAFADRTFPAARAELEGFLARSRPDRSLRERALREAGAIAERRVREFLAEAEPTGEGLYVAAIERFETLTNAFLVELVGDDGGRLAVHEGGFRKRRGFYFTHMMSRTRVGPVAWLGDALHVRLVPRVRRHAAAYLADLIRVNSQRIVGDLVDRVLESRRSLEHDATVRLQEAAAAGERALAAARERQAAGAEAVAAELGRLRALRDELRSLPAASGTAEPREGEGL
jgi:GTP-binding protein EngB required for normal cell division